MKSYQEALDFLGEADAAVLTRDVTLTRVHKGVHLAAKGVRILTYTPRGIRIYGRGRSHRSLGKIRVYTPLDIRSDRGVWSIHSQDVNRGAWLTGDLDLGNNGEVLTELTTDGYCISSHRAIDIRIGRYAILCAHNLGETDHGASCVYCSIMVGDKTLGETLQANHVQEHIWNANPIPALIGRSVEVTEGVDGAKSLLTDRWVNHLAPVWQDPRIHEVSKAVRSYIRGQMGFVQ